MLHVSSLSFGYSNNLILDDLSFTVKKGEHVSIIGQSGSGKSTLLKLIYGEYDLKNGQIFWNDIEILGPKYNLVTGYEFIKHVSQEFDLMPYISVEENVGQYLSNFYPQDKKKRTFELLEVVDLVDFAKTKVKLLSGGQKQRVALARALAKKPELILLDEPFSHIDNFKKNRLRRKLFSYLKTNEITCLVATHDKEDVLGYSDRILVLHDKNIIANNKPKALYHNPKKALIAAFFNEFNNLESYGLVYSHQLKIVEDSDIKATVKACYFKGSHYLIEADFSDNLLLFEHPDNIEIGQQVNLKVVK